MGSRSVPETSHETWTELRGQDQEAEPTLNGPLISSTLERIFIPMNEESRYVSVLAILKIV